MFTFGSYGHFKDSIKTFIDIVGIGEDAGN